MTSLYPAIPGKRLVVPHSSGESPPLQAVPTGATDCHHHIFDARFPETGGVLPLPDSLRQTPPDVAAYRHFKERLGLTRSVVIQPSNYGDDNRCLLDAITQFGPEAARGVAIVKADVSDAELARLHAGGVRGLRYYFAASHATGVDELRLMANRIKDLGWHLQLVGDRAREVYVELESALAALPCRIVIDHFGYAPQPNGAASATAHVLMRLLDTGNAYVKLSGVYIRSTVGYPTYADVDPLGIALVEHAPERMLWGSDWPHVGSAVQPPDGARLIDQLSIWAPDALVRQRILVDNPSQLYWAD